MIGNEKADLLKGLIALSILIPSSLHLSFTPIRLLAVLFWVSTLALFVFILLEAYYWFFNKEDEGETRINKLLTTGHLASKISTGLSLILIGFLFVIHFLLGIFIQKYDVNYKLLLPFFLLTIIGGLFLNDPESRFWLELKIKWLTPFIKSYTTKSIAFAERSKLWISKRKPTVVVILFMLLLVFIIPIILRPPEVIPKNLNLIMESDSLMVNRDFNQRLLVRVSNSAFEMSQVYLEAESQEGADSLLMGFVGSGSRYEKIQTATITANSTRDFQLIVHAASAQDSLYPVKIKLYQFHKNSSGDSIKIVDTKNVNIKVASGLVNVKYKLLKEHANSLAKTFLISNKGQTISDFSFIPDSALAGKIRMIPEVKSYRFKKNEDIRITVEPVLTLGFSELEGTLIGKGGGTLSPMEIPLDFKAPKGKKVYMAVANCGSKHHTLAHRCINNPKFDVDVPTPPIFTGQHVDNEGPKVAELEIDIPIDDTSPNEEEEEEEDPEEDDEVYVHEQVDYLEIDQETTPEQIETLKRKWINILEELQEEFDEPEVKNRVSKVIDDLNRISGLISRDESQSETKVDEINYLLNQGFDIYDQLTSEEVLGEGRKEYLNRMAFKWQGKSNLRMNNTWLPLNNSEAPNMFFSSTTVHFAWHRTHISKKTKQSVHYSAHNRTGDLIHTPVALNPVNENGRWPFIISGDNGKVYYVWQGNTLGSQPDIKLRVSTDNGKAWGEIIQITSHGKGAYSPRLAYRNNRLYVLWTDFRNNNSELMLSYSNDHGANFSNPLIVTSNLESESTPKFDVSDNYVHCVYEKPALENTQIFYNRIPIDQLDSETYPFEEYVSTGHQPVIAVGSDAKAHVSYVQGAGNESEIYYLSNPGNTMTWSKPFKITSDSAYSISPSISIDGESIQLLYHSNKGAIAKNIDHHYYTKRDAVSGNWTEALRLPGLSANGKHLFLSIRFLLPWDRLNYENHNVKISFNGKLVGKIDDNIPEGNVLLPIEPRLLNYVNSGKGNNKITLEMENFNSAHYLAAYDFKLITDLSYMEQMVFAENQDAADTYLANKSMYNHVMPDMGLYITEETKIPILPKNGQEVTVKLRLWNLGQGTCSNTIIDIFGGPANLSEDSFEDRYLLGQERRGAIKPMDYEELDLKFTYWSGLEKIIFRVRTKEEDFDLSNNVHVSTFTSLENSPERGGYGIEEGQGVLRVALFNEPGELSDESDIQLYRPGKQNAIEKSDKNPQIWVLSPGKYDVHIKKAKSNDIEQWIRGVTIFPLNSWETGSSSYNNTVSLDVLIQKVETTMSALGAIENDNTITFELPSAIMFHSDSYEINSYAADFLKKIKTLLNAYPESVLTIEGHTDNVGDEVSNQVLSEKRADAVKLWLVQIEGVSEERLKTIGYGENSPLVENITEADKIRNRRVSFILERSN